MDQLSAALGSALEEALTGDAAAPLTRDDMARKTREEIEAAVHKALISSQVLDAIRNPDLVHSLLLEMAAAKYSTASSTVPCFAPPAPS